MNNSILKQIINLLEKLVSYNTAENLKSKTNPSGLTITKLFDFLEEKAFTDGLKTTRFKNFALEIEYGEGEKVFGIPIHLDTVPFDIEKWDSDPLTLTERNNKFYGRGTTDNKGSAAIFYCLLKNLKDQKKKLNQKVKLVFLGDEESGDWYALDYYLKNSKELPDSGIVPDANFPLIFAEKGIHNGWFISKLSKSKIQDLNFDIEVINLKAGTVMNSVPPKLEINFKIDSLKKDKIISFLKNKKFDYTINSLNECKLFIYGLSAHGSTPNLGKHPMDKFIDIFENFTFDLKFQKILCIFIKNFSIKIQKEKN